MEDNVEVEPSNTATDQSISISPLHRSCGKFGQTLASYGFGCGQCVVEAMDTVVGRDAVGINLEVSNVDLHGIGSGCGGRSCGVGATLLFDTLVMQYVLSREGRFVKCAGYNLHGCLALVALLHSIAWQPYSWSQAFKQACWLVCKFFK